MASRITDKKICQAYRLIEDSHLQGPAHEILAETTGQDHRTVRDALQDAEDRGLTESRGLPLGFGGLTSRGKLLLREWLVIVATPEFGSELKALGNLREQGYEAWLPIYERMTKRNGKTCVVKAPLFPRYLFVVFQDGMRIGPIVYTKRVKEILCSSDGTPYRVPEEQVAEWLQSMREGNGTIRMENSRPQKRVWNHGDHVRIINGLAKGLQGFVLGPHFVSPTGMVLLQLDKNSGNKTISVRDEMLAVHSSEDQRLPKASKKSGTIWLTYQD